MLGLAYGDVDGDGDMDLVSADHGKDHVELYLNDGGAFVGPTTISNVDAYRVEMADINGDGHMDVLVAGGDSDRVEYIPQRRRHVRRACHCERRDQHGVGRVGG